LFFRLIAVDSLDRAKALKFKITRFKADPKYQIQNLGGDVEPPVRTNSLYERVRLARFAREDFSYGVSRLPNVGKKSKATTILHDEVQVVHWSAEIQTKGRKEGRIDRPNDQASEFALAHLTPISHSAK